MKTETIAGMTGRERALLCAILNLKPTGPVAQPETLPFFVTSYALQAVKRQQPAVSTAYQSAAQSLIRKLEEEQP